MCRCLFFFFLYVFLRSRHTRTVHVLSYLRQKIIAQFKWLSINVWTFFSPFGRSVHSSLCCNRLQVDATNSGSVAFCRDRTLIIITPPLVLLVVLRAFLFTTIFHVRRDNSVQQWAWYKAVSASWRKSISVWRDRRLSCSALMSRCCRFLCGVSIILYVYVLIRYVRHISAVHRFVVILRHLLIISMRKFLYIYINNTWLTV